MESMNSGIDQISRQKTTPQSNPNQFKHDPQPWYSIYALTTLIILVAIGATTLAQTYNTIEYEGSARPAKCYICDNYASLAQESGIKLGPGGGLAWFGGKPIIGGRTVLGSEGSGQFNGLTSLQIARLCGERVNRTAMKRLKNSEDYGECESIMNDGCAKIVTKSYRVKSQKGVPVLTAVVVSRTCATIPEGYGVGCFKFYGGAGTQQTVCYCRGDFCNGQPRTTPASLLTISTIGMAMHQVWAWIQ